MPGNLEKQLRQVELFAELSRDDLRAVARLVKRARYPARNEICHQGELGQTAYLVESGELRALRVDAEGVEREVARMGPGQFFGQTSLLLGERRDATVEVVQDATLLYLNKNDFDQLLEEQPAMLKALQMRADVARKKLAPHFKWQDPEEVVVSCQHKHNAILVRNLALPCFVLLVDAIGSTYSFTQSGSKLALILGGLLGLVPFLLGLYLVVDHVNDDYIVTNKRVVHEERIPFVRESRTEAPLRSVQNIQQAQEGLLAQLYNFGDLIIETAGERGHVFFRQIPNPAQTRDIIFKQIERVLATARAEERAAIRDTLQRQFNIASPQAPAPAPEAPSRRRRFKLTLPSWSRLPVRLFRYFIPPLRSEHGEAIIWRKHWIPLIRPIALPSLLILLATGLAGFLLYINLAKPTVILIVYGVVMTVLFPWWLWIFDDWQNDVYEVTATRIIDVERLPLFLREERREASLGMIQNISLEIPGILGNLLNYGTVTIETAGAGAFTFDYVKDPRGVQAEIFRRVEAFQAKKRQEEAERRRTELLDWFSVYDQIRGSTSPANPPPSSYRQEA
jgi:membrane protein YdbS with pleckstrin-like domain